MDNNKRPKTTTSYKTSGLTSATLLILAVWFIVLIGLLNC